MQQCIASPYLEKKRPFPKDTEKLRSEILSPLIEKEKYFSLSPKRSE